MTSMWTGKALEQRTMFIEETAEFGEISVPDAHLARSMLSLPPTTEYGIVTASADGCIISFNQGASSLFGFTMDEAIGQSVTLLMQGCRRCRLRRSDGGLLRDQPRQDRRGGTPDRRQAQGRHRVRVGSGDQR